METRISILFYGRKSLATKDNLLPIYLRVTIDGKRFEISTHRSLEPEKWSVESGKAKGNSEQVKNLNIYLDLLRNKVYNYQKELMQKEIPITVNTFKAKWLGITEKPKMLLEIFQEHNDKMKELIDKEFTFSTAQRYRVSFQHTKNFIKWKYGSEDIDIQKIDFNFITEYEFWLKSVRNCNHNSTLKYISNFRKIVNHCIKNGWILRNPFFGFKMVKKEVVREYLTNEELKIIMEKKFSAERLGQVRDIFLLSCYTGLAYADVKKLKRSELGIGDDNEKWIFTRRQKTQTPSRIPLLPIALKIVDRYTDHPQCMNQDRLLPVLSNQKMNAYLKEIADVCRIHKTLTYHMARHTFATTVTLSNGVPIETVGKMLGHKSLRTTQHYAKILDKKVSEDMIQLKNKLQ